MRAGRLSKPELKKLAKAYATVQTLIDELPKGALNRDEECVLDKLAEARCSMREILDWQDRSGEWRKVLETAAA